MRRPMVRWDTSSTRSGSMTAKEVRASVAGAAARSNASCSPVARRSIVRPASGDVRYNVESKMQPTDVDAAGATIAAGHEGPDLPIAQGGQMLANRYEILRLIGTGGMGRVYRVRDRELDE